MVYTVQKTKKIGKLSNKKDTGLIGFYKITNYNIRYYMRAHESM